MPPAFLAFTNQVNKQIRESLKALQRMSQSQPVVKLRVSLATYAPANDRKLIETRLGALTQAIEAWGYCQASSAGGDPLRNGAVLGARHRLRFDGAGGHRAVPRSREASAVAARLVAVP